MHIVWATSPWPSSRLLCCGQFVVGVGFLAPARCACIDAVGVCLLMCVLAVDGIGVEMDASRDSAQGGGAWLVHVGARHYPRAGRPQEAVALDREMVKGLATRMLMFALTIMSTMVAACGC